MTIENTTATAQLGCQSSPETETDALDRIWDIVHTPTKATNHRSAERHFMADFDAIRQIIKEARSSVHAQCQQQQPTEAMLNAARDWSREKYGKPIGNDAAIGCWQAMFAAASLSEKLGNPNDPGWVKGRAAAKAAKAALSDTSTLGNSK